MKNFLSLSYWFGKHDYIVGANIEKDTGKEESIEKKVSLKIVEELRKNIKYLNINDTNISAIVNADVARVIGEDLNIQSRIKGKRKLNTKIEKIIKKWSKKSKGNRAGCEVKGMFTFNKALRAMVRFTDLEGGFLVRHHINTKWEIPYRFELISVSMIDIKKNDEEKNILNGIEKGSYGEIKAIYIFEKQDKVKSKRVDMKDLDYFCNVWVDLSQYTAISKLATVVPKIDKMEEYAETEMEAAKKRAKTGGVWFTSLFDTYLNILKNQQDTDSAKSLYDSAVKTLSDKGVGLGGFTPVPSTDKVEQLNTSDSDSLYREMVENTKQDIAASMGTSSQIAYQDLNEMNFASFKAGDKMAGINASISFDDLQQEIIDEILERLITACVEAGILKIDDYFRNTDKYLQLEYMRVLEHDIEGSKTAMKNEKNLANGLDSERAILKRAGRDIEKVYTEQAEDKKLKQEIFQKHGVKDDTNNGSSTANT